MRKLQRLPLALVALFAACDPEPPQPETPQTGVAQAEGAGAVVPQEAGPLPPAPDGAVVCKQAADKSPVVEVGAHGGYVSVGRHLLSIPPRAVSGRVPFQIDQPEAPYVVVRLGPHGQKFSRSTYLILSTAGCEFPDPSRPLKVVRWTGSEWETVPRATLTLAPEGQTDGLVTDEVTAVGQLNTLSSYALATAN